MLEFLRPQGSNNKHEIRANIKRRSCGILTSIGFVTRKHQTSQNSPLFSRPLQLTGLQNFRFCVSGFDAPSSVQRFPAHGCVSLSPSHVYQSASSQEICHKSLTLSFPKSQFLEQKQPLILRQTAAAHCLPFQNFDSGFDAPSSVQRFPTHGCFPLSPSHVFRSASSQEICRKSLTLWLP